MQDAARSCHDEGMNWVTVHRSNGVTEAEILKNMLESFGIPARVSCRSRRQGSRDDRRRDGRRVPSRPREPRCGSPGHPGRAFHRRGLGGPPPEAV
ncbi:MAG: hypothetical protein M0C28_12135 [Candidatus Moduliflexus flocculans]|nr:hypothetical protein [Candidatus Moduliflexus flocculans]